MTVALFLKSYLEPTHHAIGQLLSGINRINFNIYTKHIYETKDLAYDNVLKINIIKNKQLPIIEDSKIIHSIYDGDLSFIAGMASQKYNKPLIVSFHGGFDTNSKIYNRKYFHRTKSLLKQTDLITVISKKDYCRIRKLVPSKKILLVPVPISFKTLPQINQNRSKVNLVTIGRFIPKKGIDIAIKVLAMLPNRYTLTIIGDGELREELVNLTKSLNLNNRVTWTGLVSYNEMLKHLNNSSLLLHLARIADDGNAEGTPQTILLAQALRIPIITTHTGSIGEIIKNYKTGIIVDINNIEQISSYVTKILEWNKFANISNESYDQVAKHHSLNQILNTWGKIYSKLSH